MQIFVCVFVAANVDGIKTGFSPLSKKLLPFFLLLFHCGQLEMCSRISSSFRPFVILMKRLEMSQNKKFR